MLTQEEFQAPRLLTRTETATLLRRTSRTIFNYEQRGLLRPVRFKTGGRPLYRLEDVESLIDAAASATP